MSKYKRIQTEFRNEALLVMALQDLGLQFEHDPKKRLLIYDYYGRQVEGGADYVVRKAEIARLQGNAWNDLGFYKDKGQDAFEVIVGDGRERYLLPKIKQRYAYHAAVAQANARGYTVVEQPAEGDSIRLLFVRR